MARIAGVDLPGQKRIDIALTAIFGLGRKSAGDVVTKAGIQPTIRASDLSAEDINSLREVIDADYTVEGDRRREISLNIKRLVDLGSYRGIRHRRGLPCRGQRTKTNARTRKGPKKTMANKKK